MTTSRLTQVLITLWEFLGLDSWAGRICFTLLQTAAGTAVSWWHCATSVVRAKHSLVHSLQPLFEHLLGTGGNYHSLESFMVSWPCRVIGAWHKAVLVWTSEAFSSGWLISTVIHTHSTSCPVRLRSCLKKDNFSQPSTSLQQKSMEFKETSDRDLRSKGVYIWPVDFRISAENTE